MATYMNYQLVSINDVDDDDWPGEFILISVTRLGGFL